MKQYLDILRNVRDNGIVKDDRTGTGTRSIAGTFFEHDMSEGFPLLTTKKVPFHLVASELQFFLGGYTDKKWLQDRGNHIWDEWCSPDIVPYGHDEETQKAMAAERDLGPIYGWQWRYFGATYENWHTYPKDNGVDQIERLLHLLRTDPTDRRMIVSAWNPKDLHKMALPPCHWSFQVTVTNDKLNLMWNQRSCDIFLGVPFNICSYALLLHLLAKETGFGEGRLCGFLGDTHIYNNHVDQVDKQLNRDTMPLCSIETPKFTHLLDWNYDHTEVIGYKHHAGIKAPIAI